MRSLLRIALLASALAGAASLPAHAQDSSMKGKGTMKGGGMMSDKMSGMKGKGGMGMAMAKGTFSGVDAHPVAGSYKIVSEDGKQVLKTSQDLSVDPSAPDVYVVLSAGAKVNKDHAIWLGKLNGHTGAQSFAIPAHANMDGLNTVVLWCKKDGVAIGTATLDASALMHGAMGAPDGGGR